MQYNQVAGKKQCY